MSKQNLARPRFAPAALLVAVILLALTVAPAAACGCGAYLPREGEAHVAEERALLRWDGRTEDIVMELSVVGRSQEAAWILPVPAHATVKLGDARLFAALEELTKPLIREEKIESGGTPAGGTTGAESSVTLLERQALGPFDVSTLAATDAAALTGWLATNGYQFPQGLDTKLKPYVDQQWFYIAVRLAPAQGASLSGKLDPLWVTFASDKLIYPMRASALAREPLPVFLYVLAGHRVDEPAPWSGPPTEPSSMPLAVKYANWVEPASLPKDSPIAPFVDRKLFLTKFAIFIETPAAITNDFVFPFAARDDLFRDTEIRYVFEPVADTIRNTATGAGRMLWIGVVAVVAWLVIVRGFFWWRRRDV